MASWKAISSFDRSRFCLGRLPFATRCAAIWRAASALMEGGREESKVFFMLLKIILAKRITLGVCYKSRAGQPDQQRGQHEAKL